LAGTISNPEDISRPAADYPQKGGDCRKQVIKKRKQINENEGIFMDEKNQNIKY